MSSFDINRHIVIGVAKLQLEYSNASIYILGYEDDDHHFVGFSEDETQEIFKPRGAVFAHNFAKSNSRFADSLIAIRVDLNYEDKRDICKYKNADKIRGYASHIAYIDESDFSLIDNNHNSDLRESLDANQSFFKSKEYLYKQYDPNVKSGVFCYWKTDDKFYREHKNVVCKRKKLFYIIREDKMQMCDGYIDTLSDEDIATFILNCIKEINISIDNLDTIPSFAKKLHIPKSILDSRINRFKEILCMYSLMRNGVLQLAESPLLSEVVSKSIQGYREDYIKAFEIQHKADIDKLKENYESQKVAFETSFEEMKEKIRDEHRAELSTAVATIKSKKEVLSELDTKISEKAIAVDTLTEQLSILEERKEQIIADYSVVREVLGNITPNTVSEKNTLRINNIDNEGAEISDLKGFIAYFKQNITNSNLRADKQITIDICELFLTYRVLMLPDIRMIKAIINTIGKCKFLSVSVGVNWNSFEHLWNGGLLDIIDSCKNDEQTVHILVLQNMNLSYIPCYMSPINDIIIGLSSSLPNGCQLPPNLWIIGTRSKERAMDIPEEYIREYGCLKYGEEYYCVNEPCEIENQYITMSTIDSLPQVVPTSDYKSYIDEEL